MEGMGGEYICVTGCIIAQLTRAWIEPFQPNNPSGHQQYIYHTLYKLYVCLCVLYFRARCLHIKITNTNCIHTHYKYTS